MLTAHSSELFTSPDELKGELSQFVRALPVDLRWTPVKCKRPCHGDDWQNHPYSLGELLKLPFNYTGFGLMTGPVSNAMVLDLDGPGHERTFLHHMKRELAALPPTVSWSSGRPHRHSRLYRVPAEWWGRITGGKELGLKGASKFELRAHGQQAVMVGKHPNDKITGAPGEPCQKVGPGEGDGQGFYDWLEGSSPTVIEVADAPEWLLERWAELCHRGGGRPTAPRCGGHKSRGAGLRPESGQLPPAVFPTGQRVQRLLDLAPHRHGAALAVMRLRRSMEAVCALEEWCSDMLNFDPAECEEKWESFGLSPGSTLPLSSTVHSSTPNGWGRSPGAGDDARPAEDDEASGGEDRGDLCRSLSPRRRAILLRIIGATIAAPSCWPEG